MSPRTPRFPAAAASPPRETERPDDPPPAGARDEGDRRTAARGRPRLESIGIIVAIVSAATGLAFNALQVNHQTGEVKRQTRQSHLQTEQYREQTREFRLQLLSQYYMEVNGAGSVLSTPERRRAAMQGRLSEADNRRLSRYLRNTDYVAWLFNRGYLSLPGARERLARGLKQSYGLAADIYGPETTRAEFPELTRFAAI